MQLAFGPRQFVGVTPRPPQFANVLVKLLHAATDLVEPLGDWLQALRPQAELFKQCRQLPPQGGQLLDNLGPLGLVGDQPLFKFGGAVGDEPLDGGEIVRHPPQDLLFLDVLGLGRAERPFEGELARGDFLENFEGGRHGEMALHERPAIPLAADLDFLGEVDLAFAGQQRNVPHLAEVHPDGVARRDRRSRRIVFVFVVGDRLDHDARLGAVRVFAEVHPLLFEPEDQFIDQPRGSPFVGEIGVNFLKTHERLGLRVPQHHRQRIIELGHRDTPFGKVPGWKSSLLVGSRGAVHPPRSPPHGRPDWPATLRLTTGAESGHAPDRF